MTYVDGYVMVVKKNGLKKYKEMATMASKMWKKHGALEYFECVGDDMYPNMGKYKIRRFPHLAKIKPGEKVIFSFIIYKNKKHRDEVNKKVHKDMEKDHGMEHTKDMPFDVKKMAYGGFQTIVHK